MNLGILDGWKSKPRKSSPQRFAYAPEDALAGAHKKVETWIEDAIAFAGETRYWQDLELKTLPSGEVLLGATKEERVSILRASLLQVMHWDKEAQRFRDLAKTDDEQSNVHLVPGFRFIWDRRRLAKAALAAMLRGALDLQRNDLIDLLKWCGMARALNPHEYPLSSICRSFSRYAKLQPLDQELREYALKFVLSLRANGNLEVSRLGTKMEQLFAEPANSEPGSKTGCIPVPVQPGPLGHPGVLSRLKQAFGLVAEDQCESATEVVGNDGFELRGDSPLRREHEILTSAFDTEFSATDSYYARIDGRKLERLVRGLSPDRRGKLLIAAMERAVNAILSRSTAPTDLRFWRSRAIAHAVWPQLTKFDVALDRDDVFHALLVLSLGLHPFHPVDSGFREMHLSRLLEFGEPYSYSQGERFVLHLHRASLILGPPLDSPLPHIQLMTDLIRDGARFFLVPGERWSDQVNSDLSALPMLQSKRWIAYLRHCLTGSSVRPLARWMKRSAALLSEIGTIEARLFILRWLRLVNSGRIIKRFPSHVHDTRSTGDIIHPENALCLRGFLWSTLLVAPDADGARACAEVAVSTFRKIPGVGPRAIKVANAAIHALSQFGTTEAVSQLGVLMTRVKVPIAQKAIEKALCEAAEKAGISREDLDEMSIPSFGLTEVGGRVEQLDDFMGCLQVVDARSTQLTWKRLNGKPQKSIPKEVKDKHGDDVKALKQAGKDIERMLAAQRDRLDRMFREPRPRPYAVWRERYLDHPLVGVLARRLIWTFASGLQAQTGLWCDGELRDAQGRSLQNLPPDTTVQLWHPIGRPVEDILRWRNFLAEHEIRQPIKQAYREVYLLTDAERNTETYSNRYAAHVLRQHQFNALCAARGWKNKLRLMVDNEYPPACVLLPHWNLRGEFWIEGIGDEYGVDTNESGTFNLVSTDQVRFYPLDSTQATAHAGGGGYGTWATREVPDPIPLVEIPPLVFSEVMRDIDLFVGVASVGNDPTWADGGPGGRHGEYWAQYAWGELTETAATRRQILESLLPRLNIADRCTLSGRFLIVRGTLRTYKIHLGSANILMEPNDQYLCIVPGRSAASLDAIRRQSAGGKLYLPFEGDERLSIILSKALMLADDASIMDETITLQIRGR